MELLIGALVYTWVIARLWTAARTDHELAKQGIVSPRLQAKYGAAAAAQTAGYGFWGFLGDAMRDRHEYRMRAMGAARTAPPAAPGQKVRFRDRLAAAGVAINGAVNRAKANPVVRRLVDPVEPRADDPEPAASTEPDQPDPPVDTVRFTDRGRERWDGTRWIATDDSGRQESVRGRTAEQLAVAIDEAVGSGDWQTALACLDELRDRHPRFYRNELLGGSPAWYVHRAVRRMCDQPPPPDDEPDQPAPTSKEALVTVATGEATNFETAVPQLDALSHLIQQQQEQAFIAQRYVEAADGMVDALQARQRQIAQAAQSLGEHLQERNLDAATLTGVQQVVEALSPADVDRLIDHLEQAKATLQQVIAAADVALGSVTATRGNVVGTYADAANVVSEKLSGDSRFLGSDSGSSPAEALVSASREPAPRPYAAPPAGSPTPPAATPDQ